MFSAGNHSTLSDHWPVASWSVSRHDVHSPFTVDVQRHRAEDVCPL